jgi:hypothetical protein
VLLEEPFLPRDVEERAHLGILRRVLLLRRGHGVRLRLVGLLLHEARKHRVKRRREKVHRRDDPGERLQERVSTAAGDPPDDEALRDDPAEENDHRGGEPRLADAEGGERRSEAEEPSEDGALRRKAHGDARNAHVLGGEERPETRRVRLEKGFSMEDREALERLREAREENVDDREERGEEERDTGPHGEADHGTPSGPSPKAERRIRRCSRNIVPPSVS